MADDLAVNKIFHDHECAYYDERFVIVHDQRSALRAVRDTEDLLSRPLRPGERVLDVGCGTGWLAAGLVRARPDLRLLGMDLSAGMLSRARAAGAWPLVQADAAHLPLPDSCLDLIVARGVLHHLGDVGAALAEWRRVLLPAGAVVLTSEPTPAVDRHAGRLVPVLLALVRRPLSAEEDFWEVASMAANLHVFTPAQLSGLAHTAGFGTARLAGAGWLSTLLLTTSYVLHGRRRGLARRIPWRSLERVAAAFDRLVTARLVPERLRHTVVGVLRP
ncbi:MAG TPA: class I SAM-dependent methyltransferase [Mycobacteriales bacterium]|jgi:ubiquinone/menaquinone biosynthesis C-methylase UbiE|nr:class I SAM-dependent methyltransferase [Mycobacteriales bacterium]